MSQAAEFADLSGELAGVFSKGVDASWPEMAFDDLALRSFAYQFSTNPVYQGFARGRGVSPEAVGSWQDIPAVPASGFKAVRLVSGDPGSVERVFRTSGTTVGTERGEHHVLDLELYRASLLPNFSANLVLGDADVRLLSLIPTPAELPDSSLSYMIGCVANHDAFGRAEFFVDAGGRIDHLALRNALARAEASEEPVLLVGTAFALVHWMDAMDDGAWAFRLPAGSRLMETGGFKGRSRTLSRKELYAALTQRLGVPTGMIVNEYGMTELLSQFYEPVIREGSDPGLTERRLVGPPWVRTRVLDPVTLSPLPDGSPGLLCHLDLANLGSVCGVLTEDMGVIVDDGFRVLGRSTTAEPRGCSLAMDELMSATSLNHEVRP
ncbi:MAG: coenzyme F390 synthetase [Gemmatimonadota bacterium]|nr:MAG: coenzyme F390 synthetase [Gemmatimonadota bacterium]